MRIVQVATLVTPDGAYGGPIRVAINQTRSLRAAGHDVELVAAARGFGTNIPDLFDGVPIRLFPARAIPKLGFSGTYAPDLQQWLKANLSATDVAHIHMGRDMVTLPAALAARAARTPYIVQTHGMVAPSRHPLAGIVDRKWTIPALRGADHTLYLTPEESGGLNGVTDLGAKLEQLHNGVPESPVPVSTSENDPLEVLFLARLHERKRPLMFVELAKRLHVDHPGVRFVLAGPDGGEGRAVQRAIDLSGITDALSWEGPIAPDQTAERISRCSVYVLPSIDEPFPMSVLEALAQGKPAVVTESCGLAESITSAGAGAVSDSTLESLTTAVDRLLTDAAERRSSGENALALARTTFSMNRIAEKLENLYEGAVSHA
ncbi:glycosyltransferase [Pseudarthrobacter quantipunctorum]|uniref:Glycosyltransferase n=1 Tax=Pseudarthrobacter quantipunctorum TaxID=3128980 RepID=A0ABZ2R769_9MICC